MNGKSALIMRATTLLIICVSLGACGNSAQLVPTMKPAPCAAEKPAIDIAHVDGYFVIPESDMGKLTGYMAALEAGCITPKQREYGVL